MTAGWVGSNNKSQMYNFGEQFEAKSSYKEKAKKWAHMFPSKIPGRVH